MRESWYLSKESPEDINKCFLEIKNMINNSDKQMLIVVEPKKQSRSAAQRKLVNAWYDQWAKFTGESREIERNRIMYKCGLDIFRRDDIEINGVKSSDTINCIELIKSKGMIMEYNHMIMDFCSKITSSSFNVKQNAEYIDNVYRYAMNKRVPLYIPNDCINAKFEPVS